MIKNNILDLKSIGKHVGKFSVLLACGFVLLISSCASNLPADNSSENPEIKPETLEKSASPISADTTAAETIRHEEIKLTTLELQKFAYELGFDPKKELSYEQKSQILNRKKLRELERSLDSQKERLHYSKVLPWLNNDQEKLEILSIPSIEGRQVWINKNKIWSRAKALKHFDDIVESQDIALGMPAEYVRRSWGEPTHIEVSGNSIYKNERWQYLKQVSTPQGYKQERRYVYFEGGRVVGWETE